MLTLSYPLMLAGIMGAFLIFVAGVYVIFFITGGCITMARTALNDRLDAHTKFRWMLAQVYFPPASIAYVAMVEKNRKFQIICGVALMIAVFLAGYHVMRTDFKKTAVNGQNFVKGLVIGINEAAAKKAKQEEWKKNHQHEAELKDKQQMLRDRLNDIETHTVAAADLRAIAMARSQFFLLMLAYRGGDLSEGGYTEILNRIDQMTAGGAFSAKDAALWQADIASTLKRDKAEIDQSGNNQNTPPLPVTGQ